MNKERILQILLAPHLSEKSSIVADENSQFVFKVALDATKLEIKNAVEQMFDVDVLAVQTARVNGKNKQFGRTLGKQKDWKKAYVSLREGQDIDFLAVE